MPINKGIEMQRFLGIDPGLSGAACLMSIDHNKTIRYMFKDWSDPKDMYGTIAAWHLSYEITMTVFEKVHARPGMAAKAMFSFGQNTGHWEMILLSLGIPFQMITPQGWQKGLIVKSDGVDTKTRAKVVALRLFPELESRLIGPRGGVKDGRIDALLIAEKARRMSQ